MLYTVQTRIPLLVCIVVIYFSSSLAMTKPDRQLIAQVMLYSQGFRTAEVLASKIVPFFKYVFQAPYKQ